MKTILTIAHREYTAMIATKAFLLTLVLMPLMMAGGLIVMPWASRIEGVQERKIVVADGTLECFERIQQAANAHNDRIRSAMETPGNTDQSNGPDILNGAGELYLFEAAESPQLSQEQRLQYSDAVRRGEVYALVEIPAELMDPNADPQSQRVRFISASGALAEARGWLANLLTATRRSSRLEASGIDPQLVAAADIPVDVAPIRPLERSALNSGELGDGEEESKAAFIAPFLMMILMFMIILLAAQPMLESSMEEKTHRISEILLGTVTPTQMMTGKLLGNVAGSMVIFLIYGIGGFFMLRKFDMLHLLPLHLVLWFLLFQILAVLFYSAIFMTVGAAVSQLKEAQSLLLPVWLLLLSPLMIWVVALKDPNGVVATTLSFFPPATPLMMILRLGTGVDVPAWQPPLAALLLVVAVAVVVVVAGRIYRVSLLRTEGVRSVAQFVRRAI